MRYPCCEKGVCGYSCIAILFLLGLGCIIQLFFVPPAVEDAFYEANREMIVITKEDQDDNNEHYRDWISNYGEDAPLQLFEYWIYNITNPYDVPLGEYPTFDLIGPFTYRRYENKTNPEFFKENGSSIVQYEYNYNFIYQPDRSTPDYDEDDIVWTISGAMMGLFSTVNHISLGGPFFVGCVDEGISEFPGEAVFYHTSIRNLTRGIRDPWIESDVGLDGYCEGVDLWDMFRPTTLYSLIADGVNKVIQHTGEAQLDRIGELEQYRNWTEPLTNTEKLEGGYLWKDHEERVSGSRETRNWPPENWLTESDELLVWSIEKFRITKYTFDRNIEWKGVDLMRFRISDHELAKCQDEELINGTIIEGHTCKYYQFWEDGIANLTNLRGSPSFLSKGRFLDAPFFINDTNIAFGLDLPERDEDDQYFDIDPKTGRVLRNFHNYQINFKFIDMPREYPNNFSNFSIYDKLIPFAYVRVEAIATDDQMEFYKNTLYAMDLITNFSLYGGPALAVVFFGFMFFILCIMKQKGAGYVDKESQYGRLIEDNQEDGHNENNISMHKYGTEPSSQEQR